MVAYEANYILHVQRYVQSVVRYSDFTQKLLRLHLGYDRNLKGHFGLTYSSLWLREP